MGHFKFNNRFKIKILILLFTMATSLNVFCQKKWTLKQCVEYALKNNISLAKNKLNLKSAKIAVKSQKGNFLPSLNASTGGRLNFGSSFDPVSNNRISTSVFGGNIGLNTQVNIFNGFRNLNSYKQAKLGVVSSELDLNKAQNDIALNVLNTYLNVLFAKENLRVAKQQIEVSRNQVVSAQEKFNSGDIPKGDLLTAKATVADDLQRVTTQENSLSLALLNLSQLLQISPDGFDVSAIDVPSPSVATLYDNSNVVYQKALSNQPEIKKAKLDITNSGLSTEIAKASYLPSISASASASTSYSFNLKRSSNVDFLSQLDNNLGYGIGLSISIPIFNGFKTDASVERSKVNELISENNLENEKLRLRQTIEKAFLDTKAASKAYKTAESSLKVQKEAFKNAQERYNLGAITNFDFDQTRARLINAESQMIRAKYDYIFKTKVLKFYFGESILE